MNKSIVSKLALCFIIFLLSFLSIKAQLVSCNPQLKSNDLTQYVGRFKMTDGSVLFVKSEAGELTLRPIFWRSIQSLVRETGDDFGIEGRADRKVSFVRDSTGCVNAVKVTGFGDDGIFPRLDNSKVPIELLLVGQSQIAAAQMVKANPDGVEGYVKIAQTLLLRFPSKSSNTLNFLNALAKHYPRNSAVHSALGDAYIAMNNRHLATLSYRKAYELDATNQNALRGLRRLHALLDSASAVLNGWKVPFALEKVFQHPNIEEIKAVEADWAKRDLSPQNVVEAASGKLNLGNVEATVRIISHSVHGQKHYGAIIVPDGITAKAPVILDLKGVSWNYFPLDLNQIISPKFLGAEQKRFIYIVPSFRGEILKFNGVDYTSEGDRSDSWDGATDDALALLNAALSITPQADSARIAAFGKSRGGSLALLAGIRDSRIKMVLDWAGPVDWFELMGTEGWTQKEIAEDGLFNKATPKDDGGQFIERYFTKAIEGKWNLRDVRLKMLASSPLYFAKRLPHTQVHYGIEDEMVPIRNGRALDEIIKQNKRAYPQFEAFFHENSGHDLNQKQAYVKSKKLLLSLLR